jgi:DNA-binding CsgD family transcriptional regulator
VTVEFLKARGHEPESEQTVAGMVLDWFMNVPEPACLLDAQARVLAMNERGWVFLLPANGFHIVAGHVAAMAAEVQANFRAALGGKRDRVVVAPLASGATLALVAPSRAGRVLVRFRRPGFAHLSAYAPLAQHFGLSLKQARVAADIVMGKSLEAIADKRGITVATVRSHLKIIFGKLQIAHRGDIATALLRHMF